MLMVVGYALVKQLNKAALWAEKLEYFRWVEKMRSENLRLGPTREAIRFKFYMKGALVMMEICVLCGWWFSNQFDIVSGHPIAATQLVVSCSEL